MYCQNRLWLCLLYSLFFLSACGSSTTSVSLPQSPPTQLPSANLRFFDITSAAGLFNVVHSDGNGLTEAQSRRTAAGLASGDFNNDGFIDLYVVAGRGGSNYLLKNNGDETFTDIAQQMQVNITQTRGAGATFADMDGDGDLDLFVGAVDGKTQGNQLHLFRNDGDQFTDVITHSGLQSISASQTLSASFGDIDGDGLLDLFLTHWGETYQQGEETEHLWKNEGDFMFTNVSAQMNISDAILTAPNNTGDRLDWTFSGTFADIDNDADVDLLITSDFGNSRVLLNDLSVTGGFLNATSSTVMTDENGMGSAVADFDNDGRLDWFVSSISPPPGAPAIDAEQPSRSGNRLYRNVDDNTIFQDVTTQAGVREGFWGWGSCFADFNNDGHLDLFHVNGWDGQAFTDYAENPVRLFMANGDGTFTQRSEAFGLNDSQQGRGVACFDLENDGDIDIAIVNNNGALKLYQNNGVINNYLTIKLRGLPPNTQAVGARVYIQLDSGLQMREVHIGNNYVSHDPTDVHFGVGDALTIEHVMVRWPDSQITSLENVSVNQSITIDQTRE